MMHELYGKINGIEVCSCHFDLGFYAMKTFLTIDETEELICPVSSKIKLCFFFFDGTYIVCCERFIVWAANNHDGNLHEIVSEDCFDNIADLKPVNCIDWLKVYENEIYFCFSCRFNVSAFLVTRLHTLKY